MCLEGRRSCAGVSALFATERFFSGMNQHVALEIRGCPGGVIALCARKRLLTTMNQHMAFQIAPFITDVDALVAIVGLLSISPRLLGMFSIIICSQFHDFFRQGPSKWCHARLKDNC